VFLTSGELGLEALPCAEARRVREREAEAAAEVLGIRALTFLRRPDWFLGGAVDEAGAALRPLLQRESPRWVYLPHPCEWHPDHQAALRIVSAALSGGDVPTPQLLAYEVWTPLAEYDEVEDVSIVMAQKLRAVRCYQSQLQTYRYDRAIRGLNQYRGIMAARCRYAEVFQHVTPTV
jgi:LmbE family N-acetylglucosaminyl deacetylase